MEKLQWHPAFFACLKIVFAGEKVKLESEHNLGTKPMQIDVLAEKECQVMLGQNIGRIFRRYNVIEYKSPEDYLSVDDYYKVYGYTCFYKSEAREEDAIAVSELTMTLVCRRYPRKLATHLKKIRGFGIEQMDPGIYYIHGEAIPVQLIVTSRLSEEKNFWLKHITNDLKDIETVNRVVAEYTKHQNDELYKSMMNVIVKANRELFEEVRDMCEALHELWKDDLEKAVAIEMAKREAELVKREAEMVKREAEMVKKVEKRAAEVTKSVTKSVTEQERLNGIRNIMKNLSYTAEQAMTVLDIPKRDRKKYMLLLQ